jgi:energy-coupling factor transporter ATP-binding protein EcfA2
MPEPYVRADGYPLLEYCVARLLGRHDGLLIHASTAIVDGFAYVFVGHSGAGKSTMAAIAEAAGARIPTDDRTIITSGPPLPMAWGTPWHGSLIRKSPDGAPIRGLYLLKQAKEDRCEPLPPGRAVKELFVRLIQPRLHRTEVENTLRILERIVQQVPVAQLHFRPTAAAFELALSQGEPAR